MGHFSVKNDIKKALTEIDTPTADAQEARFFGNGGSIIMVEATAAQYVRGNVVNGLVQPGKIYIGTYAVDNLAATAELAPIQAAKALALHEMGHAAYASLVYSRQVGDNAPMSAKVDWCMFREGTASFYAYSVAKEMGWQYVAGTNKSPNLYTTIDEAVKGLTAGSTQWELAGIAAGKAAFAADPKYVAYCNKPENWNKPQYIPAEPPQTGGGPPQSGSPIHDAYNYPPTPGGYYVLLPSNLDSPDPFPDFIQAFLQPNEVSEVPPSAVAQNNVPNSVPATVTLVGIPPSEFDANTA